MKQNKENNSKSYKILTICKATSNASSDKQVVLGGKKVTQVIYHEVPQLPPIKQNMFRLLK